MNVLIVYAHPEPTSLNGALKDHAVAVLEREGHRVEVSDLYAMRWKAVADADDFPARRPDQALDYGRASGTAFATGTQAPDVAEEQRKLLWADAVIFQFPLWWYGMPAILKGWVDRVYALGFAYGVGPHEGAKWGRRFGEGTLQGKRAMVVTTVGGRAAQYGPRGVNGAVDDLLWPIQHGVLFYPGMTVLPPLVLYEVLRVDADGFAAMARAYGERLLTLGTTAPIPFRTQNGGDYDDVQVLRPGLAAGAAGLAAHQHPPAFAANVLLGRPGEYTVRHFAPSSRDAASRDAAGAAATI